MKNKSCGDIVAGQGESIKVKKDHKIRNFFVTNIWNILGPGLAVGTVIVAAIDDMVSKNYSISCANFYGVDRRYFSGTEMFEDKVFFSILALALFLYPFIISYVNKKINSKLYMVLLCFLAIYVLFAQQILYTGSLIERISWKWVIGGIIVIFLLCDILIVYFILIREFFWQKKKFTKLEKFVLGVVLIIYMLSTGIGFFHKIDYDISDQKAYEVIEGDRAIISIYDEKFVVMDCEIQDGNLILRKGRYHLEEMIGVPITYYEYKNVICE